MSLLPRFKEISTFVFDVDGVLTDGTLWIYDDGQMVRRMNIKDGYALQLAIKKGYRVLVISGGTSEAVKQRLFKLGIQDVYLKVENKTEVLEQYCQQNKIPRTEVLYMGDDIPDYAVMKQAGLCCAPADAAVEIKHIAHYISRIRGGQGCVREIIEKVMKLRGDWDIDTTVSSK
ncbi:KdsC family phosphatase [Flavihumibacter profundi]|jgi:3-deoxy-D-manno-octulosonate 8-phosphate phosphatase (KDO 8-P phosphatase)|uniref:KdsC family phosphatase n=1 Tax=Flavihumibacter profundi TaxID=2716883 RepID=UPI001CC7BA26|nr:HAD-IIIA family hydrolase [Flavihumibacter profundi]MBZ5856209.1 HAD-IIIA family hydrolase [Flavihumibacter profundi]